MGTGGKTQLSRASRDSSMLIQISPDTLHKLQAVLLEMYWDVAEVCEKYQIPLFIIGGSCLGAIRHQGMIPWDDDMDLSFYREDFGRFEEVFERELGDKYVLNAPNFSPNPKNRFPRILKKGTRYRSLIEPDDPTLQCIYLDVFLLDNTPDNPLIRKIKGTWCNFLYVMSWEVFFYKHRTPENRAYFISHSKRRYYLRMLVGFLFSFRKPERWFNLFDRAIQCKKKTRDLCIASGRKRYFGEIFRRDQFLPGRTVLFAGMKARVFSDTDPYLRNLYGDYMQLPPPEQRESHTICEIDFGE